MKQKRISLYLKCIDVILVFLVIAFEIFLSYVKMNPVLPEDGAIIMGAVTLPILWALGLIAVFALYEFWKVCTEIGRDNSFSQENATSFHHMTMAGMMAEFVFIAKILLILTRRTAMVLPLGLAITEIVITGILMVLCECLSKLIANAYEMKAENDLTI